MPKSIFREELHCNLKLSKLLRILGKKIEKLFKKSSLFTTLSEQKF